MAKCLGAHSRDEIDSVVAHVFYVAQCAAEDEEVEIDELDLAETKVRGLRWAPKGYRHLGNGQSRVVVALCSQHVLKIDVMGNQNLEELQYWRQADKISKLYLCPILKAHMSPRCEWLLMARCKLINDLHFDLLQETLTNEKLHAKADLVFQNLGYLDGEIVVLDYGNVRMRHKTLVDKLERTFELTGF